MPFSDRFAAFFCASLFCASLLGPLLTATPARSSELSEFHAAAAEAFDPYRTAWSYLRTGNPDAAAFELEGMLAAWAALEARFLDTPPDAFSDDPAFAADIERIGNDAESALAALDSGTGPEASDQAHALLQPLHGVMSDIRRRNGLYLLPDCLRDFSAAMDALWVYRETAPDLTQPEVRMDVVWRAAAVDHEVRRCEAMAPETLRQNPEFRRLFDLFHDGMTPLRESVLEQSAPRLISVLRELRSAQRLIFLRFG